MIYLVGNKYTETIDGAQTITESPKTEKPSVKSLNNVITIAVNGGPGSGKGSFEGVVVKELTRQDQNNVVILVAESARDVINQLKEENKLQETIKTGKLSTVIGNEQARRRAIAEELTAGLKNNNVYMIYDRDESNGEIYDAFFKHYNFANESLNEKTFTHELSVSPTFDRIGKEMRKIYDISYCLKPVNHEINYACANPKITGAKVDATRSESYAMAKVLHNALETGAKMVFRKKLRIIPNTDELGKPAKDTIFARAKNEIEDMITMMNTRKKENEALLNFNN